VHHELKAYGKVKEQLHAFLTSAVIVGYWSAHTPTTSPFTQWEETWQVPGVLTNRNIPASAGNLTPVVKPTA
jgi:hypothetical protein